MKPAALYARVSSDRQKEEHTINSQIAALLEYAQTHGYEVPPEWQFQDEGYTGANLLRPGLEAVRDLAAEGQITALLVHSPDRLSRKYAYQVLLGEEFARSEVELVFLKAPSGATPEDQLVVQFQGMIAEYERAQIEERCRRGKRHRAQQGSVAVLSGAPYGYRYVKKSENAAAHYEVLEREAEVVRMVFHAYTREVLNINAIARCLTERQIPTRTGATRWERSTVWQMLSNPAYCGRACFGKTERRPRQHIDRRLRQRGGYVARNSATQPRSRQDWIEIPVPALVTETTFALAQEQLQKNKIFAARRTVVPNLLQGLLVCQQCGYALYRTSSRSCQHTRYYYRCGGTDARQRERGIVCHNQPLRQEMLDDLVWKQVMLLLEDPSLIQAEIDRRLQQAQKADPFRQRKAHLDSEQVRLGNNIERLVTAYQEQLVTLEQLRQRMPELRRQQQAIQAELQSLQMAAEDQSRYLRLVGTLGEFRSKLQAAADNLDVAGRQKILRLFVKEIRVDGDAIIIRHSIPIPPSHHSPEPVPQGPSAPSLSTSGRKYLLCTRSFDSARPKTKSGRAALRARDFFEICT